MTKLNQILAVEKREKTTWNERLTSFYHKIQKTPLLSGLSRTYQPVEDQADNPNVERFPDELARVQLNAMTEFRNAAQGLVRILDVTAIKDWANTHARADVKLADGTVILADAPVTYLLFLEKQLIDLETVVKRLPLLDPAYRWTYDEDMNAWGWSTPVETVRTKKIPRVLVKYAATDKHPAQVDVYNEDVTVGKYTKIEYSGAVPSSTVRDLLDRVQTLQRAVKFAREEANMIDVVDINAGQAVLNYILAG